MKSPFHSCVDPIVVKCCHFSWFVGRLNGEQKNRERTWDSCYADKINTTPNSVIDVSLRWTVRDQILSEKLIHFLIITFGLQCIQREKENWDWRNSLFRCVKRNARCTLCLCVLCDARMGAAGDNTSIQARNECNTHKQTISSHCIMRPMFVWL